MLHMVLQFFHKRIISLTFPIIGKNNSCFYDHTTYLIRYTRYCTLDNSRMCHQCTLHLKRSNTITRTLYNIISTTYKPIIFFFITPCQITSMIKIIMPNFLCQFRITIISLKDSYSLPCTGINADFTLLNILARRAIRLQ